MEMVLPFWNWMFAVKSLSHVFNSPLMLILHRHLHCKKNILKHLKIVLASQLWNWTVALSLFSAQSLLNRRHSIAKSNCNIYVILEQTKWFPKFIEILYIILTVCAPRALFLSLSLKSQQKHENIYIFICSHCQKTRNVLTQQWKCILLEKFMKD